MKHRLMWVTAMILILFGCAMSGCHPPRGGARTVGDDEGKATNKTEGEGKAKGDATPPYVHTVVFYLREDAPKDEVVKIIADAHRLLARIPSVKGLWIGRPAEKATPKLAVSDYHVAWVLLFDDHVGLQEYLDHKLHLEFREKHAKHAERVLVYDFLNQKK
jgi:hypothetical protein